MMSDSAISVKSEHEGRSDDPAAMTVTASLDSVSASTLRQENDVGNGDTGDSQVNAIDGHREDHVQLDINSNQVVNSTLTHLEQIASSLFAKR